MKKVDDNGNFANFLAQAGNDAERAAAGKAIEAGPGAKVEMHLDEAKLAQEIMKEAGPILREVKVIAEKQAKLEKDTNIFNVLKNALRNAF